MAKTKWDDVFGELDPVAGKELATRVLAACQYMTKRNIEEVKPIMDSAKAFLSQGLLRPGENARAFSAEDVELATISRSKIGAKWVVVDEGEFGAWLESTGRETNPWEMRPKARVLSSAYLKLLESSLEDTGEVPDGVRVQDTGGSIAVRISAKQMAAIAELDGMAGYGQAVSAITKDLAEDTGNDDDADGNADSRKGN